MDPLNGEVTQDKNEELKNFILVETIEDNDKINSTYLDKHRGQYSLTLAPGRTQFPFSASYSCPP